MNKRKIKYCKQCNKETLEFLKGYCAKCYTALQKEKNREKEKLKKEKAKIKQKQKRETLTIEKVAKMLQNIAKRLKKPICVSCGSTTPPLHGGHWRSRRYKSTIFYINNVNPQCVNCNIFLHGNEYCHGKYIENTLGIDETNLIFALSKIPYKFSQEELKDIYNSLLFCDQELNNGKTQEEMLEYLYNYQIQSSWFLNLKKLVDLNNLNLLNNED